MRNCRLQPCKKVFALRDRVDAGQSAVWIKWPDPRGVALPRRVIAAVAQADPIGELRPGEAEGVRRRKVAAQSR